MKNAKGNIIDVPYIPILILIFAITVLVMHFVLTEMHTEAAATGILNATILNKGVAALTLFDKATMIFLAATILGVAISAYFIRTHPVWFVFSLFFLAMAIFTTAIITNVYDAVATNAPINASGSQFTLTLHTFRHFPLYIAIGGVIIAVAMFGKINTWFGGGAIGRT